MIHLSARADFNIMYFSEEPRGKGSSYCNREEFNITNAI